MQTRRKREKSGLGIFFAPQFCMGHSNEITWKIWYNVPDKGSQTGGHTTAARSYSRDTLVPRIAPVQLSKQKLRFPSSGYCGKFDLFGKGGWCPQEWDAKKSDEWLEMSMGWQKPLEWCFFTSKRTSRGIAWNRVTVFFCLELFIAWSENSCSLNLLSSCKPSPSATTVEELPSISDAAGLVSAILAERRDHIVAKEDERFIV